MNINDIPQNLDVNVNSRFFDEYGDEIDITDMREISYDSLDMALGFMDGANYQGNEDIVVSEPFHRGNKVVLRVISGDTGMWY